MARVQPHEHLRSIWRTSERHEGRDDFICLDRNERVSAIPEAAFRGMLDHVTARDLMGYPDAGPFVTRLAKALDMPEEYIAETAGSDAALRRLFMAFLPVGGVVVTLDPSYAMYDLYTRVFQGQARRVDYRADRRCDVEKFLAAIDRDVRLVVLACPDQPIGTAISRSDLVRIVAQAASVGAVCLVDEAYHPFYAETVVGEVRNFDNLIVTRSLSKYPGCAGLRLGYAVANPDVIKGLMAVRGGNEVSGLSLAIGCYLLERPDIGEEFRLAVERGRRALFDVAIPLGFEPLDCVTNFQLLRCPPDLGPASVAAALERRRYLVKQGFAHRSIRDCIRVSLNGPEVMTPFGAALHAAVDELRSEPLAKQGGLGR